MRLLLTLFLALGLVFSAFTAEADVLSGAQLKAKLSNTVLVLSKSGKRTKRRMEVTLRKNGTGGSLHVPSGQVLPVTWKVNGTILCLTQQDGKEFCMATAVEGDDIRVQMDTGGKTRQLKGTIHPF